MVDIFEKKLMLLGGKKIKMVTLTVTTSPTNATCKLTYNGTTYTTKSIRVEEGSTVTYSISASDYNTSSGSWVITEDTVKNVTLVHITASVTLQFINNYGEGSLTATLTVGNNTKTDSTSWWGTLEVKGSSYSPRPKFSWTVTHPTIGSKSGTGTVSAYYGEARVYVTLSRTGTWNVSQSGAK